MMKNPWIVFLMPFLVFMFVGGLEPTPEKPGAGIIPYAWYPWLYAAKIVLTAAAVVLVAPGYRALLGDFCGRRRTAVVAQNGTVPFPTRTAVYAVAVGLVGGAAWIGLCSLDLEHKYFQPALQRANLGWLIGDRSAYNPFEQLAGSRLGAWSFLAVRFLGLVVVVPIIEEMFLRGFLMRFVVRQDWWRVPFGEVNGLAVVVGTVFPMLSHPEWLAAAVWFSAITWLMVRTRSIAACVAAHAATNLVLGIYVVCQGGEAWRLL
jgi:uncharacterized protein